MVMSVADAQGYTLAVEEIVESPSDLEAAQRARMKRGADTGILVLPDFSLYPNGIFSQLAS